MTGSISPLAPARVPDLPSIDGVKLATAEKALFDLAYLSGGRSRLFTAVPELEIGKAFRWRELHRSTTRVRACPAARRMH